MSRRVPTANLRFANVMPLALLSVRAGPRYDEPAGPTNPSACRCGHRRKGGGEAVRKENKQKTHTHRRRRRLFFNDPSAGRKVKTTRKWLIIATRTLLHGVYPDELYLKSL
jgi:hypothetical protein